MKNIINNYNNLTDEEIYKAELLLKDNEDIKLWIGRDSEYYEDDDDDTPQRGQLHLFYDKPQLISNYAHPKRKDRKGNLIWSYAREIGTIQNYMFPQIKEETCIELSNINNIYI